ncbi:MAG: nicotinamide mononucleotide transporter [Flavipsychrobacter sp.]|nr:nicotinamide mononucleotide transporter [Flavipsychrobacter sp.]
METGQWGNELLRQVMATSVWEWIAVGAGVLQVLLARANNVWLYPAGIVSTLLYVYLMLDAKLYAESALNAYYLVMSIYGWAHWLSRKGSVALPITRWTPREQSISAAVVVLGWALLYTVLACYTDSTVPAWDALVSATAWAGMWLLARRKLENWILLNISNALAIPLLVTKGLWLTAGLTLFLFIVAIFGYIEWRKLYKKQQRQRDASWSWQ